jgi:hypothetical protein
MTDGKLLTSIFAQGIKEQAGIYGPVFPRLVAQESAEFLATILGEAPPHVDSLDGAAQYITSNLNRYRHGYASLAYGVGKAVSVLEGGVGAGAKTFSKAFVKSAMAKMGIAQAMGKVSGTIGAVEGYWKLATSLNLLDKGMASISGKESEASIRVSGCDYADACRKIIQEGVARTIGGNVCAWGVSFSAFAEIVTKSQHDYQMVKLEPPDCEILIVGQT